MGGIEKRNSSVHQLHVLETGRKSIGKASRSNAKDGGGRGSRTRVRKGSAKGVYTLSRFATSRLSPAEAASVGIEASLELFRRSAPGVPSGYPALSPP